MRTVNRRFQEATTSVAFNLSLSKSMVAVLVQIRDQKYFTRSQLKGLGMYDTFVPTSRRLEERGLVEYQLEPEEWPYRLTEAGEHVVALLEIAGLVQLASAGEDAA